MLLGTVNNERLLDDDLPYWLALNQRSYYFPATLIAKAIERLSSLRNLWTCSEAELLSLDFERKSIKELDKIRNDSVVNETQKLANILAVRNVNVITYLDSKYPSQLREISSTMNPPLLLFHKGTELTFDKCAAIVGTRNCSFHGRTTARKIGKKLADIGNVVVSGLARGADIEAHCGALESRTGRTVSVLAWFDPIYPEEHSEVVKEIEMRGARISENYQKDFGSMTASKFVERNRITSGLSNFIVIAETGEDGGTVRQAELANRQGKPVFVLSPRENERAGKGFTTIVEKNNGIPFSDMDDLMTKIKEGKLESERKLSEFNIDSQMTLG